MLQHLSRWMKLTVSAIRVCSVTSFYGVKESLTRALVELNSTTDETLVKTLKYRIKDIIDNYEYYLQETNQSMTQVS